ncbi:hypothetical protein ACFYYR_26015 [Streptomyces sp. NPDC001922]
MTAVPPPAHVILANQARTKYAAALEMLAGLPHRGKASSGT